MINVCVFRGMLNDSLVDDGDLSVLPAAEVRVKFRLTGRLMMIAKDK